MREMVSVAHLTFPNYTEACYLTDTPIKMEGITWEEAGDLLDKLRKIGSKSALITSCKIDGQCSVAGFNHFDDSYFHLEYHEIPGLFHGTVAGFNHFDDSYFHLEYHEIPGLFHGTGDIFSAVLIGHLLNGESLKVSTRTAMDTVFRMIDRYRDTKDKNALIHL